MLEIILLAIVIIGIVFILGRRRSDYPCYENKRPTTNPPTERRKI